MSLPVTSAKPGCPSWLSEERGTIQSPPDWTLTEMLAERTTVLAHNTYAYVGSINTKYIAMKTILEAQKCMWIMTKRC